jgi:hypothetical protein
VAAVLQEMGSEGSPFVDLTDDSLDGNSLSSNHNRFNYIDNPRSSTYVPSTSNPAKRSRIDIPSLNPAALLNPRAYVGNGSSTARPEIQSFQGRQQLEMTGGSGISLNKRMEALHGLKDRKAKAPTPKEIKRDVIESQDRQAGNSLLSKNVINGAGTPNVIDLTGITLFL